MLYRQRILPVAFGAFNQDLEDLTMTRYQVTVPPTAEMGSYKCIATESYGESVRENALWDYNSARQHDGLPPLHRMPAGTIYTRVQS